MSENKKLLAPPIVATTAKEALAKIDVYKTKPREILNSIQDIGNKLGIDISAISIGAKAAASVMPLVKDITGALDKGNLLERVIAVAGSSNNLLKQLPSGITDAITNNIGPVKDLVAEVNGVARLINSTDFKNLNDISRLVNSFSGENSLLFEDKTGIADFVTGVIDEAKKAGLPSTLDQIVKGIKDPEVVMQVAANSLGLASEYSDLVMLKESIALLGEGVVDQIKPNLLESMSSQFTLDSQDQLDGVHFVYEEIKGTFMTIRPDWLESEGYQQTEPILNSVVLSNASSDFKAVFKDGSMKDEDPDYKLVYAASTLGKRDVQQEISRHFPNRVLRV